MVILHEYVHFFIARCYGYKDGSVQILPFGAVLNLTDIDHASVMEEVIISLSGPIFNLVLAVIFYALSLQFNYEIIKSLLFTNLSLGIFNLVPTLPLDGGRILRALFSTFKTYRVANLITIITSMTIGSMFMMYYLLCFLRGQINFTFGIIAFYIIFYSIKEKERVAYIIMSDIIKKKFRFMKKGYMDNKMLSIYCKENLLKALSLVEKNRYIILTVLNEDMQVLDIIYECEIIEGLKNYGNILLEDYVNTKHN
jgi:stage IV sporulation protein FB